VIGDVAILHTHDVDGFELDLPVAWGNTKERAFMRTVISLAGRHAITICHLPMNLRVEVRKRSTHIGVELSHTRSMRSRAESVQLRRCAPREGTRSSGVIEGWSGAAPYWEKHHEIIRQMFEPVTQALVEDALIASRHAVLDIATGPGEPALSVAALVGPEGKVIGIDPVPEMVAAARRARDHDEFRNTQFDVASAEDLPFPADSFDAVVSRFGVMFFPSPVDAVREMLRVLKPGRKLALAVWHVAEGNPFFYTLSRVIERYVDSRPPAPDAPETFRFAIPGKLRDVLGEAGAMARSERLLQFTIERPSLLKIFGYCDARCVRSFVKRRDAFKGAGDSSEASVARSSSWVLHRSRDEFPGSGSYRQRN
jgi:SAM-dependent methyltransferase